MKWVDPPDRLGAAEVNSIVKALKTRKGEWALVKEDCSSSLVDFLEEQLYIKGCEYTWTVSGAGPGLYNVYARCVQ